MNRKEKLYIRLFAFLSACVIAITTIYFCGFTSFADDNTSLVEMYGINDNTITYSDYESYDSSKLCPDNLESYYLNAVSLGLSVPSNVINTNPNINDGFGDYVCLLRKDGGLIGVLIVPSNSKVLIFKDLIWVLYSETPTVSTNGFNIFPMYCYSSTGSYFGSDSFQTQDIVVDGVNQAAFQPGGDYYFVSSSCEVLLGGTTYGNWDRDLNSLSDNVNSNYGSVSGETAENNLYFKDFSISYDVGSSMTNGNITFFGTPNEYMIEHPDEFTLVYTYTFDYKGVWNFIGGKKYQTVVSSSPYQIPLSQFINNGNYLVDDLKIVEQSIPVTYSYSDGFSQTESVYYWFNHFNSSSPDDGVFQWQRARVTCNLFVVSNGGSVSDSFRNHSGEYSKSYNFLTGVQATSSNNSITENPNPYNNSDTSSVDNETDVDINNTTDHVNSNNIPSSNNPNNNNGTGTNGNVVIYNNNTLNGGSASGGSSSGIGNTSEAGIGSSLVNTFFNTFNPLKMLFNAMIGDTEVVSDEIIETIGANKFLTFVSDSFGFMPSSFWVSISTFFGACLVVLIIAFIFKVIISIL